MFASSSQSCAFAQTLRVSLCAQCQRYCAYPEGQMTTLKGFFRGGYSGRDVSYANIAIAWHPEKPLTAGHEIYLSQLSLALSPCWQMNNAHTTHEQRPKECSHDSIPASFRGLHWRPGQGDLRRKYSFQVANKRTVDLLSIMRILWS